MLTIRLLVIALAGMAGLCSIGTAWAANAPGITATEIKIGQTQPYSGSAAIFGAVGKAEQAYFRMIDDQGGVNGRKIVFLSLDDAYDPGKTLELTHRLVEQDQVAAIFAIQGASHNLAIRKYLNDNGIPQLFTVTGADVAGDYQHYPWTMGGTPVYRIEAQIYGRHILIEKPDAKIAVLYQNDNFGKAYLVGLKQVFGKSYEQRVVKAASYEETDTTIDPQIMALQASGADTLITAATAKHAVRAIAKVYDLGWHPMHFITFTASSVPTVLAPAGLDKSKGLITATSYEDPGDSRWTQDGSLAPYDALVAKYLPGEDRENFYFLVGYTVAQAMIQVLKQCGDDLSRENIMRQAASLRDFQPVGLLPGVSFFTSRTKYLPIVEAALQRFDGEKWILFGDIMAGR